MSAGDHSCSLILVEDSQDEADLLLDLLRDENVEVDTTHFLDGHSACQYLLKLTGSDRVPQCLVLLDLNLPKMNGKEILQNLNGRRGHGGLRIIIFSGSENPSDKYECLATGAHAYYVKPWEYDHYEAFIKGPLLQELRQVCPCV